jgi:hypothetical protein
MLRAGGVFVLLLVGIDDVDDGERVFEAAGDGGEEGSALVGGDCPVLLSEGESALAK